MKKKIYIALLVLSVHSRAEQVGLRIDFERREINMIVASSELQEAMDKVVKIMRAAETVSIEASLPLQAREPESK